MASEGRESGAAAAVGARVVVAVYEHRHGVDVRAFQSETGARTWRCEIAERWWEEEFDDERPTQGDIGQAYFESIEGESFTVHEVEVVAA